MRVSPNSTLLSKVSACSQGRFRGPVNTGVMDTNTQNRIRARDAAFRLLNRLTTGAAVGALAGVGVFGVVSASTIPGITTTSQGASTATSPSSGTSTGLGSSPTPVSSASSGSGVVVSGGT